LSSKLVLGDTNKFDLALLGKECTDIIIASVKRKVSNKDCMPFTSDGSLWGLGRIGRSLDSSGGRDFRVESGRFSFSSGFLK
jgi:hypothetical protein